MIMYTCTGSIWKVFIAIIFLLLGFEVNAKSIDSLNWKIGVAKINITPNMDMWMAGYAFREKPSQGNLTELWAKALVLEDLHGKRVVFISTDLNGIRKTLSNNVRSRLKDKFDLNNDDIVLNSSHTHTGPVTDTLRFLRYGGFRSIPSEIIKVKNYANVLEQKLITLVENAINDLEDGHLYFQSGITRFQVNRRNNNEESLKSYASLIGPNDYSVPVIKATDLGGHIKGILFGYSCHNTVLDGYEWSGDYAGYAQIKLEKEYSGSIALFFQGTGGDQNPLPRHSIELAIQYGNELAFAVETVLSQKMMPLKSKLKSIYKEIDLKYAKGTPSKKELLKIINDTSEFNKFPYYQSVTAKSLVDYIDKYGPLPDSYPYPIQVIKAGSLPIFTLGGEVPVGYSIRLKEIYGTGVIVLGYTNDVMGYIPTERILNEGGYEANNSALFTTPWAFDTENEIIKSILEVGKRINVLPKTDARY